MIHANPNLEKHAVRTHPQLGAYNHGKFFEMKNCLLLHLLKIEGLKEVSDRIQTIKM